MLMTMVLIVMVIMVNVVMIQKYVRKWCCVKVYSESGGDFGIPVLMMVI